MFSAQCEYLMVGIFWPVETAEGVSLITHKVMLDIAEEYGDCLTSPVNHYDAWRQPKPAGRLLPRLIQCFAG